MLYSWVDICINVAGNSSGTGRCTTTALPGAGWPSHDQLKGTNVRSLLLVISLYIFDSRDNVDVPENDYHGSQLRLSRITDTKYGIGLSPCPVMT